MTTYGKADLAMAEPYDRVMSGRLQKSLSSFRDVNPDLASDLEVFHDEGFLAYALRRKRQMTERIAFEKEHPVKDTRIITGCETALAYYDRFLQAQEGIYARISEEARNVTRELPTLNDDNRVDEITRRVFAKGNKDRYTLRQFGKNVEQFLRDDLLTIVDLHDTPRTITPSVSPDEMDKICSEVENFYREEERRVLATTVRISVSAPVELQKQSQES